MASFGEGRLSFTHCTTCELIPDEDMLHQPVGGEAGVVVAQAQGGQHAQVPAPAQAGYRYPTHLHSFYLLHVPIQVTKHM